MTSAAVFKGLQHLRQALARNFESGSGTASTQRVSGPAAPDRQLRKPGAAVR